MTDGDTPALAAIAGATGNSGRELVRAAKARGLRVRALVRSEERLAPVRDCVDEVKLVQVTEAETLRGALDGVDYVVSALGKTYQKDNTPRRAVDVDANLNLFEEARRAGVKRTAFVSVFGADPDSPVSVIAMKGEVERALEHSGMEYVIIQPSGFFSDMWELFQMASKGTLWAFGDGNGKFNPVSLVDLADYTIDSLLDDDRVGQRFPVGGPDALSPRDMAAMSARILGKKVRVRTIPIWLAKAGLACIRPFGRNRWELGQFFVGMVEILGERGGDCVLPSAGDHHLEDYYRQRYAAERSERA